jgi:uncharacterized protein (TIGR04222 family)
MMSPMLRASRRSIVVSACVLLMTVRASAALAKSYSADRFDSTVRVLPDGTLDVTETVVFRFQDGTFREVFREIPTRRTDGIEVVRAEMQGARLPFGTESGTAEVRQRNGRVRVVWRFRPVEDVTRTFLLNYRVTGAIRGEGGADLLVWRATPGEHAYTIGTSTLRFELPAAPIAEPGVSSRKTGSFEIFRSANAVEVRAARIGTNGWIDTALRLPAGSVLATPPLWQQRAAHIQAQSINWIAGAAMLVAAGFLLMIAWRQGYDRPPDPDIPRSASPPPPDDLSPALGGVVAANGGPRLEHAMAALFALADRGEIEIEEKSRGLLGQRDFQMTRRAAHTTIAQYEWRVLDLAFGGTSAPGETATLSQARSRITRGFRKVSADLRQALAAAGLLDQPRMGLRRRYQTFGIVVLVAALAALIPAVVMTNDRGPWTLLILAALLIVALSAFIFGATITPLSNEGYRRGHRWRTYRDYLSKVARGRERSSGVILPDVLPIAVALGLAGAWAKFLKTQGLPAPAWFRALPSGGDNGAFVAFIAHGGASAHGGAHGAAGGGAGAAAGGGASGAG